MATTGTSLLPDIGSLAYNGVTFSALYKSNVSGPPAQDEARRTTKYVEYTLSVEGLVTLNAGDRTTDATWETLRNKLSVHGGTLVYQGKGFGNLVVNQPGGTLFDVAFGPVPKILAFQPLGASRSAMIRWEVVFRIAELRLESVRFRQGNISATGQFLQNPPGPGQVLQYNYEANISYDEDGYSGLSLRGTLEIPMTRKSVDDRTLADIVDAYRQAWLDIQIDLTKFKVTKREFHVSRDKRTCEWSYQAEELAPMGLPLFATNASGGMSVRPAFKIPPLGIIDTVRWYVTLHATYTIGKNFPRRAAWEAFAALMWSRMNASAFGELPVLLNRQNQAQQQKPGIFWNMVFGGLAGGAGGSIIPGVGTVAGGTAGAGSVGVANIYDAIFGKAAKQVQVKPQARVQPILTDFGFDEGLYKDSKTISFQCAWFLATTMQSLFAATGLWTRPPGVGGNEWATSIQEIMGWRSWLSNQLDPTTDLIVDLGGGTPPLSSPFTWVPTVNR